MWRCQRDIVVVKITDKMSKMSSVPPIGEKPSKFDVGSEVEGQESQDSRAYAGRKTNTRPTFPLCDQRSAFSNISQQKADQAISDASELCHV